MLQKIVSLLRGRLRVRAEGTFPERVLNICSARGIALSDPVFSGSESLVFTVARRDWARTRAACADAGAAVRIERAEGAPFALGRLRRRRALAAGLMLCAALLALNACFIWDLRVEGNGDVSAEKILHVLAENGVRRGAFAFSHPALSAHLYHFSALASSLPKEPRPRS